MVGTRKGLWIGRSEDREDWSWSGPHHDMEEVYSGLVDTRGATPRLFAGAVLELARPTGALVRRPRRDLAGDARRRDQVPRGQRCHGRADLAAGAGRRDGVVYAGTEPGAVWKSVDGGETFALDEALWNHPQKPEWGAGFGGQAFHTILPHPTDPDSVTVAISTGGVYQTTDGGASWAPRNQGIRADFLPEDQRYPEFGQCVHKVTRHPSRPERLFAQNHGGVYRSDDEGGSWTSIGDDLPSDFGFPVVVHPHRPDTIYVFPLGGGDGRYPPEGKARIWRSDDAGESWTSYDDGLPDPFYVAVMRDAMCADTHDPAGLYIGGRNGAVWASKDDGETWREIVSDLPDVMSVKVGVDG